MRIGMWALALAACGRINFDSRDALVTYRDVVIADNPPAYWRLDDADSIARDETGRTDGTYMGTCTHHAPGLLANDPSPAVLFDGASCYITIADAFNFPGNAPYMVEVWVATTKPTIQHFFTRENRM